MSLQQTIEQIRQLNFHDPQLLATMATVEDHITFFETVSAGQTNTLINRTIPFVLILNRINQMPSLRTSRYL